jgi:fructosamine-3-kinase
MARLHARRGRRFGWHRDNWLGLVRQVNPWTDDCYEFFARYRVLRYLPEPEVRAVLEPAELSAIERICHRLPELVPPSYPALTHGDLWHGNVLSDARGRPALIDPAVSWSWPEVDLSMMLRAGAPETFFSAYQELRPAEPGWRDHFALLHLRELLSVLAHGELLPDAASWAVPAVRDLIRKFG